MRVLGKSRGGVVDDLDPPKFAGPARPLLERTRAVAALHP